MGDPGKEAGASRPAGADPGGAAPDAPRRGAPRQDGGAGRLTLHATAVALDGRALLIRGPSGSGKSALAFQLMALGAGLIADDLVILTAGPTGPVAACPPAGAGRIEARGIGILAAPAHPPCTVALVFDRGHRERERMPPRRSTALLGFPVPLVHDPGTGDVASVLYHYLRFGPAS
ncbi:HPr kinase/phosphorylase [Wenxinia saemankumensis]|uniref:Hpr(Ser) kinase/phosphatase n=1 Tax=Wenxinia saemankumensis TaxID=1447782 RepID=A0A1M6EEX6_9RHOB|nr:serine kinase [Wenxinia saemankumensis]SHI83870.1 Hpr(Ser) kinase/phosphatase [Wenxinia saemankumensis]